MEQSTASYFVVLKSVPQDRKDDIVTELSVLFNVEQTHSEQIAGNTPIILLSRLNEQQVANVRSHIVRLEKLGAELDITQKPGAGTRSLTWPVLPAIATQPANIFVCPGCGERFSVGSFVATPPKPRPKPVESKPAEAEPVEAEVAESEPVEAAEVVEAVKAEDKAPDAAAEEPVSAEVVEAEVVQAEPEKVLAPSKKATPEEVEDSKPEKPIALEGEEKEDEDDEDRLYRVSLRQKIRSGQKKKEAAVLIAKYQNVSEKQALKLADKSLVTILRRAPKELADTCKKEFRSIGVGVRVMPVPK